MLFAANTTRPLLGKHPSTIPHQAGTMIWRRLFATTQQRMHPQTMKAVVLGDGIARLDHLRSVPALQDDRVLVRPMAVAINPTDWRHVQYGRAKDGCILGCDYAGIVESVGSAVRDRWKPGDRIFGCAHGANLANPDDGVFAEFAAVLGDLQMRVPDFMSFEEAATVGLGAITVGQGLYQKALQLDLPVIEAGPAIKDIPVLIYGGSSATGALGIQYAKRSGYTVITTCSPANFDYVKSLGADIVVDYNDKATGSKIRDYTNNLLEYAWDTISIEQSAQICAQALTTSTALKPVYGTLLPVSSPRSDVRTVTTVMHTVFGKAFKFGPQDMAASREDHEFGKQFFRITEKMLSHRILRPHKHRVGEGGLKGVIEGMRHLQEGKARAVKLVYRVADTP